MMNENILKGHKHHRVSEKELYEAYKLFFNTFSSEQRLRILNLLRKGKMNVSEIIEKTGFEQSVVSHNLKRLISCGFVEVEVKGKYRYYKVNDVTIKKIMDLIDGHMRRHCLQIIRKLKGNRR